MLCQCPKTGNSHFHYHPVRDMYQIDSCVNALRRATLISTVDEWGDPINESCVNALRRATLISTRKEWSVLVQMHCVNALRRATLISTLSLQNPLFFNGFRTRFCRYFSEYSEKGLFPAIFCPVYNLDIFSSGWRLFLNSIFVETYFNSPILLLHFLEAPSA